MKRTIRKTLSTTLASLGLAITMPQLAIANDDFENTEAFESRDWDVLDALSKGGRMMSVEESIAALDHIVELSDTEDLAGLANLADELANLWASDEYAIDPMAGLVDQGMSYEEAYEQFYGNQDSGYSHPDTAYFPDLPSNDDSGKAGSYLRPSGNLRDHTGGIASQTTTTTSAEMVGNGTYIETEHTTDENGDLYYTHQVSTFSDGSTRTMDSITQDDGSTEIFIVYRDREGSETERTSFHFPPSGSPAEMHDIDSAPVAPNPFIMKHLGKKLKPAPTRKDHVNPGPEGAMSKPKVVRFGSNFTKGIAVNPNPEESNGTRRYLDPETARKMLEEVLPDPGDPPRPE